MPILKTYDLFISHAWKYGEDYNRLIGLLNNAPNFKYRNYSAPEDNPLKNTDGTAVEDEDEIKAAIKRKIRPVNAVLVISGMYYNYRKWMQFEIDTAKSTGKPIIALYPYAALFMPAAISNDATEKVRWNTSSIVSAIREYSL